MDPFVDRADEVYWAGVAALEIVRTGASSSAEVDAQFTRDQCLGKLILYNQRDIPGEPILFGSIVYRPLDDDSYAVNAKTGAVLTQYPCTCSIDILFYGSFEVGQIHFRDENRFNLESREELCAGLEFMIARDDTAPAPAPAPVLTDSMLDSIDYSTYPKPSPTSYMLETEWWQCQAAQFNVTSQELADALLSRDGFMCIGP